MCRNFHVLESNVQIADLHYLKISLTIMWVLLWRDNHAKHTWQIQRCEQQCMFAIFVVVLSIILMIFQGVSDFCDVRSVRIWLCLCQEVRVGTATSLAAPSLPRPFLFDHFPLALKQLVYSQCSLWTHRCNAKLPWCNPATLGLSHHLCTIYLTIPLCCLSVSHGHVNTHTPSLTRASELSLPFKIFRRYIHGSTRNSQKYCPKYSGSFMIQCPLPLPSYLFAPCRRLRAHVQLFFTHTFQTHKYHLRILTPQGKL